MWQLWYAGEEYGKAHQHKSVQILTIPIHQQDCQDHSRAGKDLGCHREQAWGWTCPVKVINTSLHTEHGSRKLVSSDEWKYVQPIVIYRWHTQSFMEADVTQWQSVYIFSYNIHTEEGSVTWHYNCHLPPLHTCRPPTASGTITTFPLTPFILWWTPMYVNSVNDHTYWSLMW